jgi:tRNA-dihydrouridine synthase
VIADVKRAVSIPVIGCGGVDRPEDAPRMLRETGCDAAMIARAALGNPWVFADAAALLRGEPPPEISAAQRTRDLREHVEGTVAWCGEALAMRLWRKYGPWYVTGRPGAAEVRTRLHRIRTTAEALALLQPFFEGPGASFSRRERADAEE